MRLPIILACLALAACDIAPTPEQQSEAARKAAENTELRDHIQQPIDRAKAAGEPIEEANKAQAQAIEDAGG